MLFQDQERAERENFRRNLLGVIDVRLVEKKYGLLIDGECGRSRNFPGQVRKPCAHIKFDYYIEIGAAGLQH